MADIPEALVEKAAQAVYDVFLGINLRHPAYPQRVGRAVLDAVLPEIRAAALRDAADAWQTGQWADAPRSRDQVQERIANAQFVTDWLRDRAAREAGDRP